MSETALATLKTYLSAETTKTRLMEIFHDEKRAGSFAASIINVYRDNKALQNCTPESVAAAAMVAGALNLPIEPQLGQAGLVPYGKQATFQLMYRGLTQLALRTGQYKTIHCTEVYVDEFISWNPITAELKFNESSDHAMRYSGKKGDVVGHYAMFELLNGFRKEDFMTHDEVLKHAKQYSRAYQRDLAKKHKACPWSTDPIAMGNKTVLLRLIRKYGMLSVDMQQALVKDVDIFEEQQTISNRQIDDEMGSVEMEAEFVQAEEEKETETTDDEAFLNDE